MRLEGCYSSDILKCGLLFVALIREQWGLGNNTRLRVKIRLSPQLVVLSGLRMAAGPTVKRRLWRYGLRKTPDLASELSCASFGLSLPVVV